MQIDMPGVFFIQSHAAKGAGRVVHRSRPDAPPAGSRKGARVTGIQGNQTIMYVIGPIEK